MSAIGILVTLQLLLLLLGHHARGSSVWSDDDDPADVYDRIDREPIHVLRHHQHSDVDMVTQGPRAVRSGGQPQQHGHHTSHGGNQVRMRHHNRHGAAAATTTTIVPPLPEEHRLRHSLKMYKPYALIESREQDFGVGDHRRRGQPLATPRPTQVQLAQRSRQSPYPSIFNVTAAKQLRYFDRDALYTSNRRSGARWPITTAPTTTTPPPTTTPSTTTTSTTTAAPPTVRMRHSGGSRQPGRDRKQTHASTAVASNKKPFLNTYDRFDDPYFSNVGAAGTRGDNEDNEDSDIDDDRDATDDDGDDDYDEEYDDEGDDGGKLPAKSSNRLTNGKQRVRASSSAPSTRSMLKSANSAALGYDDDLDELDELDGGRQDHGGRDQRVSVSGVLISFCGNGFKDSLSDAKRCSHLTSCDNFYKYSIYIFSHVEFITYGLFNCLHSQRDVM